jgi:cytidylate kinase
VGKQLSQRLNIPFYDREITTLASEDSGINALLFSDERLNPDLLERLLGKGDTPQGLEGARLNNEEMFNYQAKIIRRLADQGSCVIIGRCADFVLRERANVIRVFVHADEAFCLEQAMRVNSMEREDVQKKILELDTYRAKYYKHHTGRDWYDARNYDLSLDSGVLGFDGTLEAILQYAELRSKLDGAI